MAVFPQENREHVLIASAPMTDFHHWSDFQDRHAMKGLITKRLPKLWQLLFEMPEKVGKKHGKASPSQLMEASGFAFEDRYILPEMGVDLRNIEILGAVVCESQRAKGYRLLFFADEQTLSYWGRDFAVGMVEIPLPSGWHDKDSFFLSNKDKDIAAQMVDYSFGKASRGDRLEQLTDLAKLYSLRVISDKQELVALGTDERGFRHIQVDAGRIADETPKSEPATDEVAQPSQPVASDGESSVTSTGRIKLGNAAPTAQANPVPGIPRPAMPRQNVPVPETAPETARPMPPSAPSPYDSGSWGRTPAESRSASWQQANGWGQGGNRNQPDGWQQASVPPRPPQPTEAPEPPVPQAMPLGSWESSDDFTDYEDEFTDYEDEFTDDNGTLGTAQDATGSLTAHDDEQDGQDDGQDTWHGFKFDSPDDYAMPTASDGGTMLGDASAGNLTDDTLPSFPDTWGSLPVAEPDDEPASTSDGSWGFDDSWDSFTDYDDIAQDDDAVEVAEDDDPSSSEPTSDAWGVPADEPEAAPAVATPVSYRPVDGRTGEVLRLANEMSAWNIRNLLGSAGRMANEVRGRASSTDADGYIVTAFALLCQQIRRNDGELPSAEQVDMALRLHDGQSVSIGMAERGTAILLDAFYEALLGQQVHVISEDEDFIMESARRASEVLTPFGLTVGQELEAQPDAADRIVYKSDIIYGTPMEFGCDYLRNSMSDDYSDRTWMRLDVAIIDDASDIIAKGPSLPLSIKGTSSTDNSDDYHKIAELVRGLDASTDPGNEECDITVDMTRRKISLKAPGARLIKERAAELTLNGTYEPAELTKRVQCALQAEYLLAKGRDYAVSNGGIVLLDPTTGRAMRDRRWSGGLHEAVEAKEGLQVHESGQQLATMTVSEFIALYGKAVAVN